MAVSGLTVWTAAMRSGHYDQITGELVAYFRVDDTTDAIRTGHCCLGVACEAMGLISDTDPRAGSPDRPYLHGTYLNIASVLPGRVAQWLGLEVEADATIDPYIDFPVDMRFRDGQYDISCTTLNDELRLTFDQIADLVDYFGIKVLA